MQFACVKMLRVSLVSLFSASCFLRPALGKEATIVEWPEDDLGPRSPERVAAGKQASKFIGCQVCNIQMMALLMDNSKRDAGSLDQWIRGGALADVLDNAGEFCKFGRLMSTVEAMGHELEILPERVRLTRVEGEADWIAPTDDDAFNWKAFAVHHSCLETFRRDGEKVAKAAKKAWKSHAGGEADEEEGGLMRVLNSVVNEACFSAKTCVAQTAEDHLEKATARRDKARAEQDPLYSPESLATAKVGRYDKFVNYYKVLGVDEHALPDALAAAYFNLAPLYATAEGRGLAGIGDADAKKALQELRDAKRVLSDHATRRKYDGDRDRLDAEARVGLSARKPDKLHIDGKATLLAFEEELDELKSLKIDTQEL